MILVIAKNTTDYQSIKDSALAKYSKKEKVKVLYTDTDTNVRLKLRGCPKQISEKNLVITRKAATGSLYESIIDEILFRIKKRTSNTAT